jgi:imidazolonepropionase
MTVLTNIGRLFTGGPDGTLADAAVAFSGDRITWVGFSHLAPDDDDQVDCRGALVTAGLVDAHTHPVYARPRLEEISRRSAGESYVEAAAAGGGIEATVASTSACPPAELKDLVRSRLRRWLDTGTTTVEVKTGYHLEREGELGSVHLLRSLADDPSLPDLAVTFLGAHARASDEFAAEVASWSPDVAAAGARFADVFCDEGYFSVEQARVVLEAGRRAGLRPRIHADELARTGGSQLAAEMGAASADHLLRITSDDIAALAGAAVVATLCPITALALGSAPPARALLDAGVVVALGTDHNPGTSGVTDMTVVIALAVAHLGLSVDEALVAGSWGGARSLELDDRGTVATGQRADLVLWDADHEGALAWTYGVKPRRVWRGGASVGNGYG